MLKFEGRNKYETPCVVYFENEDLEVPLSYDIWTTRQKIVLSLHEMPRVVYFEDEDLDV